MPQLSDCTLRIGAQLVAAAYFREQNLIASGASALRTIATTNRINFEAAGSTGKTTVVVKWPVLIAADATTVALAFSGWYMSLTGEVVNPNDYTIEKVALVVGSTVIPITFNGDRSKVVTSGAEKVLSDEVSATVEKASIGWIKARLSVVAAGQVIPHSARITNEYAGSQVQWFDPSVTTVSDTDVAGNFTVSGSTNWTTATVGPCPILLGRVVDCASFIAVGDSIAEGTGDNYDLSGISGKGFVQRSTVDVSGNNPLPMLNFCRGGTKTDHYIGANTRWMSYVEYSKYAISEHGTNDLGSGGSGDLATIQSNLQTMWAALRNGGVIKIVGTHLLCRTYTNNQFIDLAGQTILTGWTAGGKSEQHNAWLTAQVGTLLDAVVDTSIVRDASVPQKWATNGSSYYATTEGTHPSAFMHANLAHLALRPVLLSL